MSQIKLTPMLEQYLRVKAENPEALLFYRMGDFYEMFFEDAVTASRELQIALTSRNPEAEHPVPMCGVPHHAAEAYLAQLLDKGFKVAICDQIEDPKTAKGLVKRAVTRVLTPGTVVEEANLVAKAHNYLSAIYWSEADRAGGLTFLDVSTGEWSGLFSRDQALLWQWVQKIGPRELLAPDGCEPPRQVTEARLIVSRYPLRPYFDLAQGREKVQKAQSVADLAVLDLADKPELVRAMGALLTYLVQTQKREPTHLAPFSLVNLSRHLKIDEVTERNLELFVRLDGRRGPGTLWRVLDRTVTPMGGRLLEARLKNPWLDMATILENQEAAAFFLNNETLRRELRQALDDVFDLERGITRVFLGRASPKDYAALRQSLGVLPRIEALFRDLEDLPAALARTLDGWDNIDDARALLERALVDAPPPVITEGGLIRAGYDPELDELLELSQHGESRLSELLETERRQAGLQKLKLGYNRVFGYYLELSRAGGDPPPHFIRRQTLANCERYVTTGLKELEEKILAADDKRKTLEYSLFSDMREKIAATRDRVMATSARLARLDVWQGLAETAAGRDWTRPVLTTDLDLVIRAGRHPVVEAVQGSAGYIPNDLTLPADRRLCLVTGPNMAGKSTVLRQTALIVILAQIGSLVPAAEARVGLVDRVFCRVGASDNLAMGQSTFMVEMMETARILRQAGRRSLVILDEIGRGTSTYDGLALAWAVVEDLAGRDEGGPRTLFATHYHELTQLEGRLPGVRNANIAVKEWRGEIIFLRRLVPGPADRSYGVEVARLAGVPRRVVNRAREILGELERQRDPARASCGPREAGQRALPGLAAANPDQRADGPSQAPHPLLDELATLELDRITPLEALSILTRWKDRLPAA